MVMSAKPVRITDRETPLPEVRDAIGNPPARKLMGYWFKRWLEPPMTLKLLRLAGAIAQ